MIGRKPILPVLNRGHPLAQGLIGAWVPYEGCGQTVRELTGKGLGDFTLQNSANWTTSPELAINLTAGTTDYLSLPSQPVSNLFPDKFTFAYAGFNPTAAQQRFSIGFTGSGTTLAQNPFYVYDTHMGVSNGSSNILIRNPQWNAGVWTSLACVDDGANYSTYLDAWLYQPIVPATISPAYVTDRQFVVGISGFDAPYDDPYTGSLGYLYIYERPLGLSEVQALHTDPYQIVRTPNIYAVNFTGGSVKSRSQAIIIG